MQVYLSSTRQSVPGVGSRLELFIASLLPVTAILIVGAVGTSQMLNMDIRLFIIVFLLCAIAVFFCEFSLLRSMQRTSNTQLASLTALCRDAAAGKLERRASVAGSAEIVTLADALNGLLDAVTSGRHQASSTPQETASLARQINTLIRDIDPILSGDLRTRVQVSSGDAGVIADMCNRLIEEVAHHIKEIRYVSRRIIRTANHLLEYSVQVAQKAETQRLRFAQTTQMVETLVAFIQRMSSTLQVSADLVQETLALLQHRPELPSSGTGATSSGQEDQQAALARQIGRMLEKLNAGTQRQAKLLEDILQAAQQNISLAESTIGDLYTTAQELNQSSAGIITIAKSFSSLEALAQRWLTSVSPFRLREEDSRSLTTLEQDAAEESEGRS